MRRIYEDDLEKSSSLNSLRNANGSSNGKHKVSHESLISVSTSCKSLAMYGASARKRINIARLMIICTYLLYSITQQNKIIKNNKKTSKNLKLLEAP